LAAQKSDNYKQIIAELLKNYNKIGAYMSRKFHFSHLDFFSDNFSEKSDVQDERFHQDLMIIEKG